ncbi:MAG: alkaline phosphatase family protein [Deltaproteobacteria bacterium]|nr:alkaline phosphatase family protein [Deltaproteobacteria bacterium]
MSSIWISLGPILFINLFTVVTCLVFRRKRAQTPVPPDLAGRNGSKLLGPFFREYWYWLTEPVVRLLVQLRFSPNIITFIGFCFSVFTAYLYSIGAFGYAGWILIIGSTFDMFDGRVARLTGQTSRAGAFYDSVLDRFSEGIAFLGLALYFRSSWVLSVVIIGLVGGMLVSYTRARGEGVGIVCKKGPMQRPERIAYLGFTSVLQPVLDVELHQWFANPPPFLVIIAVVMIAVLTVYTALYRTIFIMNALDSADRVRGGEATIPQLLSKLTTRGGWEQVLQRARYGYDRGQARALCTVAFVSDGAHVDVVRELCARGDLPHIQRHIIEPGFVTDATAVFPSVAGPASVPLVTGCFPGTCNIPAARWFDRTVPAERRFTLKRFRDYSRLGAYAIDFDLSKQVQTAFEYSRQAVSLLGIINRGAGFRSDGAMTRAQLEQHPFEVGELEATERAVFAWFAACLRRQPDLIFYHFVSISRLAEAYGIDHPEVRKAYQRFDKTIGDAVELLKTHGLWDHTVLAWVSGHALAPRHTEGEVGKVLARRFARTVSTVRSYRQWLEADALELHSGNAMAHLYLRRDRAWSAPRSLNECEQDGLVAALFEDPAVDLVMGRVADGGVAVVSRRGRAELREQGEVNYVVGPSGDPFGYGALPSRFSMREALTLTSDSAYPDGIVQALQLFRAPRTGDLVISATPGYGLDPDVGPTAATRGSLHRNHMLVPCAMSIPMEVAGPMRTVDLLPTLLRQVGIEPTSPLDGVAVA